MRFLFYALFPRRKSLWLLPAFLVGLVPAAFSQGTPITVYNDLFTALSNGVTTITNFNSTNSFNSPLVISLNRSVALTFQITTNVTIDAGTNFVSFTGNGVTRIFSVHPGATLTLKNVQLTGGTATNGGAIYNNGGALIISNCVLTGNVATNTNGLSGGNGPLNGGNGTNGGSGGNASGGAIYSTGPLFIYSSILTNNAANGGNGGNGGTGTGTLANGGSAGFGGNAFGGAVFSTGSSNIFSHTFFANNSCTAGFGGSGGSFTTNGPNGFAGNGSGGPAGVGGSSAGGAGFITGALYMTNCVVSGNTVAGGNSAEAEVDSNGGGEEGSLGGAALGGGLFLTNRTSSAWISNSIFFFNSCFGGNGGSTPLNAAVGGNGGAAMGGGIWSGGQVQMSFCTLATNLLQGGLGGTNGSAGINGSGGGTNGWNIFQTSGSFVLSDSILSYDSVNGTSLNVAGVTDGGYNVCSDVSMTRSTFVPTTKFNTNPRLDAGLSTDSEIVGGPFGSFMVTLALLTNSPAADFIPGVPGVTFPNRDERFLPRSTPATAGAYELNPILTIVTNASLPEAGTTLPATNLTGAGFSVSFTNTIDTNSYNNPLTFGYQWQLDGTNIYDSANYSGTTTNILTVKHISIANQGQYTLLLSPTLLEGATTSSVVVLTLTNPPVIKSQPASQIGRPIGSIVTFTVNVADPTSYNYHWMLDNMPLPDSPEFSGTNSNVLTINPATLADAGTYSVLVTNFGFRLSANARLTLVPDHAKPTILITSPLANARTNALTISGTATDNAQVTNVFYWFTNINGSAITVTSGSAILATNGNTNFNRPNTMLWSITNAPLPGTNILAVQAVDYSSNVSAVVTRRFFYKVPAILNLTTISNGGGGTLTGHSFIHGDAVPSNHASLYIGEGYSIVAAPNSTSLLGEWTNTSGTNVIVTNGNTLKFIMEAGTSIQASFVSNIFTAYHGIYNGLFYVTNQETTNVLETNTVGTNAVVSTNQVVTSDVSFETAGMLNNLALNKLGTFSGRLLVAGGNYSLAGSFDAFGRVTNHIVARSEKLGGPLIVNLDLDTNGAGRITGTVTNADWPANANLAANPSSGGVGVSTYTLLLSPTNSSSNNTATPTGTGYAAITQHGGTITLAGGLADGTPFSQSVPASPSNNVPVFVNLYAKTGILFGWLNLTNLNSSNSAAGLIWIKQTPPHPGLLFPNGFTNQLNTEGSTWVSPNGISVSDSNSLDIYSGNVDLIYTLKVFGASKVINAGTTPTNSLTGTVNLKNGLLQIIFGNGAGRATTRAFGALLQDSNEAGGYFVTKTNAGGFTLNGIGTVFQSSQMDGADTEMIQFPDETTGGLIEVMPDLPPPPPEIPEN